ncbi:MAG: glycosyltransferase family 1 protein [Dorea sp.]|nr:glycosyltransferase family 1 protein [Dorea sp.]
MERVLVTGGSNIGSAGVATMVYRWGQKFDSDKIVYDYLMQKRIPERKYLEDIKKKGGRIYTLANKKKINVFRMIQWFIYVMRTNQYKTIHINSDSAYIAAVYIWSAKRAGVKNIVVHSHCSQIDEPLRLVRSIKILAHRLFVPYVKHNSKYFLACSVEAGVWMYGASGIASPKFHVILTGEDINEFSYSEDGRERVRKELSIKEAFVIGNIGRFSYQKNHDFLIDVFSEFTRTHPDAVLILVGTGELKDSIKRKVRLLKLEKKVFFLQDRDDIPDIYSAMDVLVMPSRFEGMPATAVEAQMSFLPCVLSDSITHDVKFTGDVRFLKGWDEAEWCGAINGYVNTDRNKDRDMLTTCAFNIDNVIGELTRYLIGE